MNVLSTNLQNMNNQLATITSCFLDISNHNISAVLHPSTINASINNKTYQIVLLKGKIININFLINDNLAIGGMTS